MSIFTRLSNGWRICLSSFAILKENKRLIFFPLLSYVSLLLIFGSFAALVLWISGGMPDFVKTKISGVSYAIFFVYYLVSYFVLLFFNTALVYCSRAYFRSEKVSVAAALRFGLSRIRPIFSWAVVAATAGFVLRLIQENIGFVGRILTGAIGLVWSISSFFVIPVIAYENLGPLEAYKRSAVLMKQKWGESPGATFSFGLIQFIAVLLVTTPFFLTGLFINLYLGIAFAALGLFFVIAVMSAAEIIFIGAVYHDINGGFAKSFNRQLDKQLFICK